MLPLYDFRAQLDQIIGVSPYNVRQTDADDDLSSLKATILAAGLINPLVCHWDDSAPQLNRLRVLAGRRRWLALRELVAENPELYFAGLDVKLADPGASPADLIALSTMENTQSRPMHPVREYEAFAAIAAALPNAAAALEAIAKEFGLTRKAVRQRLALGDLSPKIRKAWLDGDIDAEEAKAYAECPDIAAQEAFFDDPANKYAHDMPRRIKRALLADWRAATDPDVRFVGEETYRAAGGVVRESLFEDERLFNGALIDRLADTQLRAEAERIKQAEGWGFVVLPGDDGEDDFEPADFEPDPLPAEEERIAEIEQAIRAIGYNPVGDDLTRLQALYAERNQIAGRAVLRALPAVKRRAMGIFVIPNSAGVIEITRGLVAIAYASPARETYDADDEADEQDEDDEDAAPTPREAPSAATVEEPAEPIGAGLRAVLDETLSQALHDAASRSVNFALVLAVARFGGPLWSISPVDLRCAPRRDWKPAHPLLRAIKGEEFADALAKTAAAPLADLTTAFCELVAASIDPAKADALTPTLALVTAAAQIPVAIEEGLKRHFRPADYFRAATKQAAIAAIRETEGEASAAEARTMKKPELIERAALVAKDFNWLPRTLRDALPVGAAPKADDAPSPASLGEGGQEPETAREPDTRSTAEAMLDAIEADEGKPKLWCSAELATALEAKAAGGDIEPPLFTLADHVKAFIDSHCERGADHRAKASQLLKAYNAWAQARNFPTTDQTMLSATMEGFGHPRHRLKTGVHYQGVALAGVLAPAEAAQ